MCGIFGIIYRNKIPNNEDLNEINNALKTLSKRGPDLSSKVILNNVALGHTRLAIIDLSPAGNQPMFSEDKNICVVFNGEIYNYLYLRSQLKEPHNFIGASDTEVLVHLYEELGDEFCTRFEGMAALGVYDKKKEELLLIRDHFGKKPLYYYQDEEVFCFASEIKALYEISSVRRKVNFDEVSLHKFLFYGYIPNEASIFKQIRKVPSGSYLKFDVKKWTISKPIKYWDLSCITKKSEVTETKALQTVNQLLESAVSKRLMADVPLGLFLSGGLDSSLIAYYMKKMEADFSSFSVCYKDAPEADESTYINYVCKKIGFKTNTLDFSDSLVPELFQEIYNYTDEYFADAAIVPLYFISKEASKKIKVVLSGDGGDEIFGGYAKYKAQQFIEVANSLFLGEIVAKGAGLLKKDNALYKLKVLNLPLFIRQFIFGSGSFLPEEYSELISGKTLPLDDIFSDASSAFQKVIHSSTLDKCLYLDASIQLPDFYLVKGDQATMAASLEMRNPFLDKELAEYAFSLPDSLKIRDFKTKYITKKLAENFYSKEFVNRKKKGFGVPLDKWIRGPLKKIFEEQLMSNTPFFNKDYIKKMFDKHLSGEEDSRFKLLRIFSANFCYNKYYGKRC
jgi:asparagine synthase (glutamine-hydrolysing)